mmetsp:Transcript_21063/g.46753  ORF Transcript_21063/g.46753 Transcript_21063/m.46753 type:complete len:182 (+) Transcript_21063:180-725(+)
MSYITRRGGLIVTAAAVFAVLLSATSLETVEANLTGVVDTSLRGGRRALVPAGSSSYLSAPSIQSRRAEDADAEAEGDQQQQEDNDDAAEEEQEEEQQPPRNEPRHIIANGSPRYDAKMKVVGAVFVACDVTECFTEFLTIKTTANELRKLIDTANAPIFGIDANGCVSVAPRKTRNIASH